MILGGPSPDLDFDTSPLSKLSICYSSLHFLLNVEIEIGAGKNKARLPRPPCLCSRQYAPRNK